MESQRYKKEEVYVYCRGVNITGNNGFSNTAEDSVVHCNWTKTECVSLFFRKLLRKTVFLQLRAGT